MNEEKLAILEHEITVLSELLRTTTHGHFSTTLAGARQESKRGDEQEGSYWWLQNHYIQASAAIWAASVIADNMDRMFCEEVAGV